MTAPLRPLALALRLRPPMASPPVPRRTALTWQARRKALAAEAAEGDRP